MCVNIDLASNQLWSSTPPEFNIQYRHINMLILIKEMGITCLLRNYLLPYQLIGQKSLHLPKVQC